MPTLTGCSVCLKRALAIAKSFSRGSASIAIAAEFFWVSVMVVFMVAGGLKKIYTVLQRTSTSDLGAHYLLSAQSTSGISPCTSWFSVLLPFKLLFCCSLPFLKSLGEILIPINAMFLATVCWNVLTGRQRNNSS